MHKRTIDPLRLTAGPAVFMPWTVSHNHAHESLLGYALLEGPQRAATNAIIFTAEAGASLVSPRPSSIGLGVRYRFADARSRLGHRRAQGEIDDFDVNRIRITCGLERWYWARSSFGSFRPEAVGKLG